MNAPALHSRRKFIGGLGGASAVAAMAGTILIEDPASADWNDSVGPNFIRVIDVTRFGAKGDGSEDGDDTAINNALAYARELSASPSLHNLPVYFPAGTYGIHDPLDVGGLRLIGEPSPLSVGSGTTIKALYPFGEQARFADGTVADNLADSTTGITNHLPEAYDEGVPLLHCGGTQNNFISKDKNGNDALAQYYKSTVRFHMSGINLDANNQAEFCLALLGNTGALDNVRCVGAKLDGILIDGGNPYLTNITIDKVGRHAIHALNANGAFFSEMFINYGGDPSKGGSAFRVAGFRRTPATPNGSGGAVTISRAQTGDIAALDKENPSSNAAPVIQGIDLDGGRISNVYMETGDCASAVKLEGCVGVHVEDCRITTGRTEPDACLIHLAISELGRTSHTNFIRGNAGLATHHLDTGQPSWTKEFGEGHTARIRVDSNFKKQLLCRNNHISDNMRLEAVGQEMIVWYPRNEIPAAPGTPENEAEYVPPMRNHTLGQARVISYSPKAPDLPYAHGWQIGDIVFNSAPNPGGPAGWVLCSVTGPTGVGLQFLNFGEIGTA